MICKHLSIDIQIVVSANSLFFLFLLLTFWLYSSSIPQELAREKTLLLQNIVLTDLSYVSVNGGHYYRSHLEIVFGPLFWP